MRNAQLVRDLLDGAGIAAGEGTLGFAEDVLEALVTHIQLEVSEGREVRVNGIGRFYPCAVAGLRKAITPGFVAAPDLKKMARLAPRAKHGRNWKAVDERG